MVDSGTQKFTKEDLDPKKQSSQEGFTSDHIEKLADLFTDDMMTVADDDGQDTGEFKPAQDDESTGSFSPVKE